MKIKSSISTYLATSDVASSNITLIPAFRIDSPTGPGAARKKLVPKNHSRTPIIAILPIIFWSTFSSGKAATIISSQDHGWYTSAGTHISTNINFQSGRANSTTIYRNFFVFSVPDLPSQDYFFSADLYIPVRSNGITLTLLSSAIYEIRAIEGSITALTAGNGIAAYQDLADGLLFGSASFTVANAGSNLKVSFNQSGLNALNAAQGLLFAVGGHVPAGEAVSSSQSLIFTGSHLSSAPVIMLESIPEPSFAAFANLAAIFCLGCRRRQKATL